MTIDKYVTKTKCVIKSGRWKKQHRVKKHWIIIDKKTSGAHWHVNHVLRLYNEND